MNIKVDINVCRVCLKSSKGVSVFSDKVLLEKFQYTTLLKITKDDGLPALFCDRCVVRLKIAYDFRRLSINSDTHMRAFINKVNSEFKQVTNSTLNNVDDLYNIKDEDIDLLLEEGYHNKSSSADIQDEHQIQHITTAITPETTTTTTTVTIIENSTIHENNSIIESENIEELTAIQSKHHQQLVGETEEFTKYIQEDEIDVDTNYIEDSQDNNIHHENDEDIENEQINAGDHEVVDDEDDEDDEEEEDYSNQIIKHQEILLMTNDEIHAGNIQEITMTNVQFNEMKAEPSHYDNQNMENELKKIPTPVLLTATSIFKNSVKNENRTHICIKCDKDFSTKTNLMRHMLTHDGIKPYQCTICGNGFTQNGSLKSHMLLHTGERPHRCEVCGRGFTQSKSLTFHMRRHTGEKPFTCITCGLNFRQKDGLKRHIQIKHSGMPSESHQCTICNRILHSKYSLVLHTRKHLYRHQQQQQPDNNKELINTEQSNKKIFKCDECNKEFNRKNSLTVHKKMHNEKQLNNNNNNSNSKVFQCGKCFKSFSIKRNLLQHLRNHNKETLDLFKCDACSIAFNTKRGLKLHRYNEHKETVTDLNECDICNIPFVSVHDLNQHMIDIHDKIDEKCGICLQNFISKKLYEDHILEHEIEQEYTIT